MNIAYTTKRGAWMSRPIPPTSMESEIRKMVKRGIECRVWDEDRVEVGAVWKEAGQWRWYFDPEAAR